LAGVIVVHVDVSISTASHCKCLYGVNSEDGICSFHLANSFESGDDIREFYSTVSAPCDYEILHVDFDGVYGSFMNLAPVNLSGNSHIVGCEYSIIGSSSENQVRVTSITVKLYLTTSTLVDLKNEYGLNLLGLYSDAFIDIPEGYNT
jgi:hypothetical protein